MRFPTFSEYYTTVKIIEHCVNTAENLEQFFEDLESTGIDTGAVMTSDMQTVTYPIASLARKSPIETSDITPEVDVLFNKLKNNFKKAYGKNWKDVLYTYCIQQTKR